ncbi:MAG TPA: hypothetical protein VMU01_04175, partial [Rhizomicrobium sp.]|nr:hypothetical protein [Rhizomicrobium sp.]
MDLRLINHLAVRCMLHAQAHGDVTYARRFVALLPSSLRWKYAKWFSDYSPVHIVGRQGKICASLDGPVCEFHLGTARRSIPFKSEAGDSSAKERRTWNQKTLRDHFCELESVAFVTGILRGSVLFDGQRHTQKRLKAAVPYLGNQELAALYRMCIELLADSKIGK